MSQPLWSLADELLQRGRAPTTRSSDESAPPAPPPPQAVNDLFNNVFTLGAANPVSAIAPAAPAPRVPLTLAECGLTLGYVAELLLKQLYVQGNLIGQELSVQARLPFPIVDEALRFLKDQRCLEVSGGDLVGRVSYRFALTELGRLRAREVFEQCKYVGPAPVPVDQYIAQSRRQTVSGIPCNSESLASAFQGFVMRPGLLEELGPAICSGRSIFVYGPPGNGKTMIAKGLGRFLNTFGGEIYVPYAVQAENTIITLFDPVLQQTTDDAELARRGILPKAAGTSEAGVEFAGANDPSVDLRWRRIRRPVLVTGGELTLEMLELQHNKSANFYNAPLQIKANGGVFLIDDFGRQLVGPKDLLNRWIIPLEERIDYLTLSTGRKFALPFEQLIIFSTNLDPRDLVDDAFLRRIRHKIKIDPPESEVYANIFEMVCAQRGIDFTPRAVEYLFSTYYDHGRTPRSSDPRDLIDLAQAICRFRNAAVIWTDELITEAARRLFHQV